MIKSWTPALLAVLVAWSVLSGGPSSTVAKSDALEVNVDIQSINNQLHYPQTQERANEQERASNSLPGRNKYATGERLRVQDTVDILSVRQPIIVTASTQHPATENLTGHAQVPATKLLDGELKPRLSVSIVTLLTAVMAASSGLGALPFFFVGSLSSYWSGMANAIACGVMLAASFDLLHEGEPYGGGLVTVGVLLGALFIRASHKFLEKYEDVEFEHLKGAGARKTVLVVGVMAAHAFGEGCGVGVSFCGNRGWAQGVLVTIAIGVHNIPEGLAKATVLVAQGVSAKQALWWSMLTCAPQPLVAVPSFLFVDAFKAVLPIALGFSCGCMVWMVVSELMPDALKDAPPDQVATATTLSAACLEAVRMALASLEEPNGTLTSPVQAEVQVLLPTAAALLISIFPSAAAAGLLSMATPCAPILLGVSCGIMWGLGTCGVLQQMIVPSGMPLYCTLPLAIGGALCLRALWQSYSAQLCSTTVVADAELGLAKDCTAKLSACEAMVVQHKDFERALCQLRHPSDGRAALSSAPDSPDSKLHRPSSHSISPHDILAASCALLALTLHGISEGWLIAKHVIMSNPDHVSLMVLCCLTTLIKGTAAAALLALLCHHHRHRCSSIVWLLLNTVGVAVLGGLGPLSAIWSLMRYPLGIVRDTSSYDISMLSEESFAGLSGALVAVGYCVLGPRVWNRGGGSGGEQVALVCGFLFVGAAYTLRMLLNVAQGHGLPAW